MRYDLLKEFENSLHALHSFLYENDVANQNAKVGAVNIRIERKSLATQVREFGQDPEDSHFVKAMVTGFLTQMHATRFIREVPRFDVTIHRYPHPSMLDDRRLLSYIEVEGMSLEDWLVDTLYRRGYRFML